MSSVVPPASSFAVLSSQDLATVEIEMMTSKDWAETFRDIYQRGIARYGQGEKQAKAFFSDHENKFLASIGCSEQELFDFVEDACNHGEPSFETALLIQTERRDYLQSVQGNKFSQIVQPLDSFPAKSDQLEGIAWLPRLIAKARAKLRGELPPELMYG